MKRQTFDEKLQRRRVAIIAWIALPIPLLIAAYAFGLARRNQSQGRDAFEALHNRRLAATGIRVDDDSQKAYLIYEQKLGPVEEHRFENGVYEMRGNVVQVSGRTRRRQAWYQERFVYAVKTGIISSYSCAPLSEPQ